ncbi:hypothetical protein BCR34DRAFT_644701 [Clohesyomyces aquaticus]|uniref:Uncharacterized protein n=1 Tax=Clohesyomyces aquaticus TaxID=1231657 RepID=A0A1Y1ZXJ7_9PLEO|nr:hypothetical protein BCR34DRAFT_644701 [Clohesyomyces aquaticus]
MPEIAGFQLVHFSRRNGFFRRASLPWIQPQPTIAADVTRQRGLEPKMLAARHDPQIEREWGPAQNPPHRPILDKNAQIEAMKKLAMILARRHKRQCGPSVLELQSFTLQLVKKLPAYSSGLIGFVLVTSCSPSRIKPRQTWERNSSSKGGSTQHRLLPAKHQRGSILSIFLWKSTQIKCQACTIRIHF